MTARPAKTQISLGIHPVWSVSSLHTQWVAKDPRFLHADSKDSDQTGRMPRLIWVFLGTHAILLVLSWGGSFTLILFVWYLLFCFICKAPLMLFVVPYLSCCNKPKEPAIWFLWDEAGAGFQLFKLIIFPWLWKYSSKQNWPKKNV